MQLPWEIETLAKPGMSAEEEADARALLSRFTPVEIDRSAREVAIRIRQAKSLQLPDALVAASAITLDATVLSNDAHLRDFRWEGYHVLPAPPI